MWHVHAAGLVQQIAAHPDEFQLVGGFDPEPQVVAERQSRWKSLLPDFTWHTSVDSLLSVPLDGIVVEGRVSQNIQWATLAVDSGLPVLLEKPAGDTFEVFRSLIARARERRLHVQMIYLFRYMSAVQELLRLARSGELGHIYEFRGRLPKDLSSYDEYVQDLGCYRGGIFFEMAGHLVDLIVALMGRPQAVTPFLAQHHPAPPGGGSPFIDNGVAVFTQPRGWGIIEVPALEVAPQARRIEVYGTAGACVIPHLGSGHLGNRHIQPLELFRQGQPDWQRLELPAATLQISDLREFSAVITGRKAPDFSPDHDLTVHEYLLRASGMWSD